MYVLQNIINYGDIYNRADITQKVKDYHNQGMNHEEIVEQIGEDAEIADNSEHDFHTKSKR